MLPIRFYTHERGFPMYETADERWIALGVWFTMEVRNSPYQCLDLLGIVDDVASGRVESETWEGEAFPVTVTKAGATARNTIIDDQEGTYSLEELREAAEAYWRYVTSFGRVEADLADWEKTWNRTHPYRGRLF